MAGGTAAFEAVSVEAGLDDASVAAGLLSAAGFALSVEELSVALDPLLE